MAAFLGGQAAFPDRDRDMPYIRAPMAENEEASVLVYALEIVLEKDILGRDVDVPFLKEKVGL